MEEHFWEWYKNKKYDETLSMEDCFNNKAFLVGCCIEYLTERGQKIHGLGQCKDFKDIITYLKMGVAWTR